MDPLSPNEPRQTGRYRLLASLGQGGMGRVLLGVSPDGRLAALKQVHPGFAHNEGFRSRFRREVETSRMVSGAYTAAVMDADPDAATPWLASVFVVGPSLREAVAAAGPLPVHSVRYLAAGLASALTEIHRVGLIHRDLKPSNVLLTDDGPRVIDFGIARAAEAEVELTHTGSIVGSPGFMSPEQAETRPLTPASDMFSLGALLVMASTGRGPFTGTSTPQTLYNVVHGQPNLSSVPLEIRQLAEPCLAKDPAQRPTPAQMLDFLGPVTPSAAPWPPAIHAQIAQQKAEVQQYLAQPATPVSEPTSGPQFTAAEEKSHRRKWLIAGCVALVLLIAASAVLVTNNFFQGDSPGQAAPPPPNTPQKLTPERLRVIDACPLINNQVLEPFGAPDQPKPGFWGDCDNFMVDRQGNDLSVRLSIGDPITSNFQPTQEMAGEYPIKIKGPTNNSGICMVLAEVQPAPQLGINLEISYKAGDPCLVGTQIMRSVITEATHSPAEYTQAPGSLVTVAPCDLITQEELVPIAGAFKFGSNQTFHRCEWFAQDTIFTIQLRDESRPDLDEIYQPIDVDGIKLYQYTRNTISACNLKFIQRVSDQIRAETVSFTVTMAENKGITYENACERAKIAAKTALPKLPKT